MKNLSLIFLFLGISFNLVAQCLVDKRYEQLIFSGDSCFQKKDAANAKQFYQKALSVKPEQQYPKDQIANCDAAVFGSQEQRMLDNAKFNLLVVGGDSCWKKKDYDCMAINYYQAHQLKPDDSHVNERIDLLNIIDSITVVHQIPYYNNIKKADSCYAKNDFKNALFYYKNAFLIRPCENNEVNDRIVFISDSLVNPTKEYYSAIRKGDSCYVVRNYVQAKMFFEKANELQPSARYPEDKIKECDDSMYGADINQERDRWSCLVQTADIYFVNKDYVNAKWFYGDVLVLRPDEVYAKDQIAKCDVFMKSK